MSIQNEKKLVIGLFGFGVVGAGVYEVLQHTPSLRAELRKVCIRHPEKKRVAPDALFTTEASLLLNDPEINVIIELTNDADAAFDIVSMALRNGKAVISANKKMIAEHFDELLQLQQEFGVPFLYESAVCASIPVIRNLEEYYDNDLLRSVSGIVNGSTNYILTKTAKEGLDFETALLQAQVEGFAETDPSLDVNGIDAVNKLSILLAHAYGIIAGPSDIPHTGIRQLTTYDNTYAQQRGYAIKLVAQARKLDNGQVAAFVLPQFVSQDSQLYNVNNEYNGVLIESSLADNQFFYGKGAGSFPTASAVLSDLSALRYNYKYEYKKLVRNRDVNLTDDYYLHVYASFEKLFQLPHEVFEEIKEWSSSDQRCHVTGIVKASKFLSSNWWQKHGTSVILFPDAIEETWVSSGQQVYEEAFAV